VTRKDDPVDVDQLELAHQVLAAQPFSELLGARITAFEPGLTELALEIDGRHLQQFGLVHGGIWCYAADNALTFAAGSVLGPSVVTGGLSIHYLRGAREGTLRARARVAHHDQRHATCRVDLSVDGPDGETALCAIAHGTAFATRRGSDEAGPRLPRG
jgi:uncharacterized protein (TIGR00369 family)